MLGLKGRGGFTLVEVAIIILTLAILSAILVPNLGRLNALARFVKVKEDLMVICSAMKMYLDDTGESAFYQDGNGGDNTPDRSDDRAVGLLIGDGDIPDAGTAAGTKVDQGGWRSDIGDTIEVQPDRDNSAVAFSVDSLQNHLIQNAVNYRTANEMEDESNSSGVSTGLNFDPDSGEAFNSLFAWRGPYINDRVYPDPWGNRYGSNVFGLFTPSQDGTDGYATAVVCYSAGPDEQVDTAFNQPDGWLTGDDDQTVVLNSGGW